MKQFIKTQLIACLSIIALFTFVQVLLWGLGVNKIDRQDFDYLVIAEIATLIVFMLSLIIISWFTEKVNLGLILDAAALTFFYIYILFSFDACIANDTIRILLEVVGTIAILAILTASLIIGVYRYWSKHHNEKVSKRFKLKLASLILQHTILSAGLIGITKLFFNIPSF